jgi:RND family efflux transporter MFP subunit
VNPPDSEGPYRESAGPTPPKMSAQVLRGVIPIVVLIAGVIGVRSLIASKPEPLRQERSTIGLLVETHAVEQGNFPISIDAQGQVMPARRVVVSSEVPGRVRSVNEEFVPGGRLESGTQLFRVDARDFSLAVESRAAEVHRSQLELQVEEGRAAVAEREWEAFGGEESSGEGRSLALRQPQRETAGVAVRAAQNAVRSARLNLARTVVRAPFNATVLQENVEVGQYVVPGAQLATLVGTDEAWVQVSVPLASLGRIRMPQGDELGARVTIEHDVGDETIVREGHVIRLLPDLDPAGSMARILVEVPDPLRIAESTEPGPPLLLGTYVRVHIEGGELLGVQVPRRAVREGSIVYVMTPERALEVHEIRVSWSLDDTVITSSGLSAGDLVITSRVNAPVEGMLLRGPDDAVPSATPAEDSDSESSSDE